MIMLVESSMPPGDTSSDDYWAQLWYARTELPERAPIVVSDDALDLPGGFRSTIVSTSGWLPVLCWIVPDEENWHLEVHTDLNRKAGDLPQVAKLITHLHMNKAGL